MRRFSLAACAALCLPGAAPAQDRPSLWDVISLDRLVQGILHSGIQVLRTQMDLQYSDLNVDLRRSRLTMTDLAMWPFFEWDPEGNCKIGMDRMTVLMTPIDLPERLRFKARVSGVEVARACLPPGVHPMLDMGGLDGIALPRLTVDVDYGMPKSDAVFRVYADVSDVARVDLSADFAYWWFDGREDMEEPMPTWFLNSAVLAVENDGAWQAAQPMVPPDFTGAEAGAAVEAVLRQVLVGEMGVPEGAEGLDAFVASAGAAWSGFLADPQALVLETGFEGQVFLDFQQIEREGPAALLTLLQPRMALAPKRVSDALPVALLSAGLDDGQSLTEDERARVGRALMTGAGAPRNVAAGRALLEPLAEAGYGGVALTLAQALERGEPEAAYLWALQAGADGEAGAGAVLDRLERRLGLVEVLLLQEQVSGQDSHPGAALASVAGLREQAAMRLSGDGVARHYGIAAMWAMLAKAAGDPEAADMLDEIDEIVRLEGARAVEAWAEIEARYAALATEVWIGQNLPARYRE